MAALNDLLKPFRFETDPNSPKGAKHLRHWLKIFTEFLERCEAAAGAEEARAPNRLQLLYAYVSADVFEYIEDCETYDAAITKLKSIYIKTPNIIFARHKLATRKQQSGETLEEFYQSLHLLSKDCQLRDVTAEAYRNELVRDAFINGIYSHSIRQRLLENNELTVAQAFDKARSLRTAQEHSEAYLTSADFSAAAASHPSNSSPTPDRSTQQLMTVQSSQSSAASSRLCYFCGLAFHHRDRCPAKEVFCHTCGKKGHFSKVCRSRFFQKAKSMSNCTSRIQSNFPSFSAACPASLLPASLKIFVNNVSLTALVDSGSSESYINSSICSKLKLDSYPTLHRVQMASSAMTAKSTGFCLVDIMIDDTHYSSIRLNILEGLCSDIILGLDFQSQHENLIIKFNGKYPDLVVAPKSHCLTTAAKLPDVSLFSNVTEDAVPIATKSRRFNQDDRAFIQNNIDELLTEGIIRASSSPWRAQVLIVKDEYNRHRKRMCIDYSQTINIYTELDAYPLPRIDDMVNQLAQYHVFSTFDLKGAYHQVAIKESDSKYTAFEANGKLYEFTRIPFGVKNGVAAFQRAISQFVENENLKDVYPYLDNITVAGRTQEEHDKNVESFLNALHRNNVTLNDSKTIHSVNSINILGYVVTKGCIKPDPERLRPLKNFPPPVNQKQLRSVLGMFAYYAKWIDRYADKIRPLAQVKLFPIDRDTEALRAFQSLKQELENAALHSIDENEAFVVECDASDIAISATLNQGGRPVAFMSRTLQGGEVRYPAIEKEATAIIEAIRKWSHLLLRQTFTLITDQRSVAFMLDSRRRTKIKNNKIQQWRIELASYSYHIKYRPGGQNSGPDSFSRAFCATCVTSTLSLQEIHANLCHPGVTRLLHYVRTKNLPYSTTDVKRATSTCKVCAEVKPQFYKSEQNRLIKATQPMERLSLDFKGPISSINSNKYLLVIVDEYSRFPFVYPCKNTASSTVINCLENLFSLTGIPSYIHSDNASSFKSHELKQYLLKRGIASSKSSIYNPAGNGQAEKTVGTVWKAVQLALRTRNLPMSHYEYVLNDVLHSLRSLLCVSINATPHERFFNFPRRSGTGKSLPTWLTCHNTVFVRRFNRHSKNDPYVDKVELININPTYAEVRYNDGREATVSVRDLSPCPDDDVLDVLNEKTDNNTDQIDSVTSDRSVNDVSVSESNDSSVSVPNDPSVTVPENSRVELRRSNRSNKGVPPPRYGIDD